MSALTKDSVHVTSHQGSLVAQAVTAGEAGTFYAGAVVLIKSDGKAYRGTIAGDSGYFGGLCIQTKTAAIGDPVIVSPLGLWLIKYSGASVADVGSYLCMPFTAAATDNPNELVVESSSTSGPRVGYVTAFDSASSAAWVALEPSRDRAESGDAPGAGNGATVSVDEQTGALHRTVITLASTPVTLTDQPGVVLYGGVKIYDFPAGDIVVLGATASLTIAVGGNLIANADGDFGLGTATAGNDATLTGTEQNIIPSTSIPQLVASAGAVSAVTTGTIAPLDGTSSAIDLYANFLWDDTDHNGGTMTASGTVTITWVNLGDV